MVGHDELAARIERESIAAELPAEGRGAGVAGRTHVDADALALLPLVDRVPGDVDIYIVTAGPRPHRALGPVEAIGDQLDLRVGGDEGVEGRVEVFDRACVR